MPRFRIFLRNSNIHFHIFLYLVTCFLIVVVSFLCRSQGRTIISSPFTNSIGINWNIIFDTACYRHRNETVTLETCYQTCENGWSNFSENLRVTALKLLELTRFLSPNLSIYYNLVRCWGPF